MDNVSTLAEAVLPADTRTAPLQRQVETWVGDCPIVDQHRIALMLLDVSTSLRQIRGHR